MASGSGTVIYDTEYQTLRIDERRDKDDTALDRHHRRIVFYLVIALLLLATLGSACLAVIVPTTETNHTDKERARTIPPSIIAGVVGYPFGKK